MGLIEGGAIRIFRVAGINVFLHWTWLIVAAIEYNLQQDFKSPIWNVVEYIGIFLIVLLHEFGHAFACRSVGGRAERIMLWPLGGIAFVEPPPRPGAVLWSIAAGPLVNVVLIPVLVGAFFAAGIAGWEAAHEDAYNLIKRMVGINIGLLIFNILPFYPLDGGQILQSLLWFVVGRGRSLIIAGGLGTVAGAGLLALTFFLQLGIFPAIMAFFLMMQAWNGVRMGQVIRRFEALPRREGLRCPICGQAPVLGRVWPCEHCQHPMDVFENDGLCPHCGHQAQRAICVHCGRTSPLPGASEEEPIEAWPA